VRGLFEDAPVEIAHADAWERTGTIREKMNGRGGVMLSPMARAILIVLLTVTLAGCSAIAGIFKAGFWVGIIVAVIIVGGLVMLLKR
jgi:hypothetical protein